MGWADGKLVIFDYETTGKDPETAQVVACAMRIDEPGREPIEHEWLAATVIPEETEKFFDGRYTTERCLAEGQPEREVHEEICALLREHWTPTVPLCAYNICYDLTVLDRTNIRLKGSWPSGAIGTKGGPVIGPLIDPYVLDRTLGKKRRGKRKLDLVCRHYGCPIAPEDAHVAIGDVRATTKLIRVMAKQIRGLGDRDLRQLYVEQQRMHAVWAAELQEWIRGKKREEEAPQEEIDAVIVTGDWPIVPRPDIHAPVLPHPDVIDDVPERNAS